MAEPVIMQSTGLERVRQSLVTEQQQRNAQGLSNLAWVKSSHFYSAIKKNSFESVLMRWMKLEPIIQSEVSQKDKDHYNILTHIYGI